MYETLKPKYKKIYYPNGVKMKGTLTFIDQQSDDWFRARLGVITASKLSKCFTGKLAISKAGSLTLAKELAGELVYKHNNELPDNFQSYAMMRGSALEVEAKENLMFLYHGYDSTEGGFYLNEEHNIGASPDLILTGMDGTFGAEIKCPLPKTHLDYVLEGGTPAAYMAQVHLGMILLGADEWLFCSYCEGVKMLMHRQKKDLEFVKKIEEVIADVNEKLLEFRKVLEV